MEESQLQMKNLKDLEKFFKADMKIKKLFMDAAIDRGGYADEYYGTAGSDKLFEAFEGIEVYFNMISDCFDIGEYKEDLNRKLSTMKQTLIDNGYDFESLDKSYQNVFSNMRPDFIENVKNSFVGYTANGNLKDMIDNSTSINELLHCVHSYVTNNEKILQSVPKIAQKQNANGETITLYGDKEDTSPGVQNARRIFEEFPTELDCGITDIIAFKNKVLMMVRDRGHALTVEMDIGKENAMVNYFIPKICNLEMVNKIKGISDKPKELFGATRGMYEAELGALPKEIFDFIESVPTDFDMPPIGGHTENIEPPKTGHSDGRSFQSEELKDVAKTRNLNGVMKIFEPFKRATDKVRSMLKNKGKDVENDER